MARKPKHNPGQKKSEIKSKTSGTIKLPGEGDMPHVFLPESMNLDFQEIFNGVYNALISTNNSVSGKPGDLDELKKEMNKLMDSLNDDVVREDPSVLQKEKYDYSKISVIKFREELFCPERLQKLFTDNEYEIDMINDRDFIVISQTGCIVLVRVSKYLPLVRFEIPMLFKPRVTLTRKLKFINEIMSKYPVIRMISDDDYSCVTADYNYCDGLYIKQVLTMFHLVADITTSIYIDDNHGLLVNPVDAGIY